MQGDIRIYDEALMLHLSTNETEHDTTEVSALLSKLGVGSETEAIEYAMKAGIRWR